MASITIELSRSVEQSAQTAGMSVSQYVQYCINKASTAHKVKQSRMPTPDIDVFQLYYDHSKNILIEALEAYDHKELYSIARTAGLRRKDYVHVKDTKKLAATIADRVELIATRGNAFAAPEHRVKK